MVYSDAEVANLISDDDIAPDDPQDIKPFFHKSATARTGSGGGGGKPSSGSDIESEEEDLDDDDDEEVSEWSIRKCAAAGLDLLSVVLQDAVLPYLLKTVEGMLNEAQNWRVKECAILALGAVAEGCSGIREHLPKLVPFLMNFVKDQHVSLLPSHTHLGQPLIRSITCWTLSRHAKWIVRQRESEKYFQPLLFALLERILDNNKKVQEAACSAFATLEEEAQGSLVPYLEPILHTLVTAFGKYQVLERFCCFSRSF
jgi:transportin-1